MKSYDTLRTDYGVDTKNTSAANLTYGTRIMNDWHRRLLAMADWPFLHRLRTLSTEASTTFINLPHDVDQVESVFVTVSSTRYNPIPAPSRKFWDRLHYSTYTSDTPEYWFIYNGQLGIWPQPATAGNVISLNCKIRVIDLNIADYTTGTIDIVTNDDETFTGSGTAWTSPMAGRWINITNSDTAASSGDGLWYEINSITSGTVFEAVRKYGGTSLTTGASASYTIGQMPLLPETFHDLPGLYAAFRYWSKEKDTRANDFKASLVEGVNNLFTTYSINDLSHVIDDGEDRNIVNPNLLLTL